MTPLQQEVVNRARERLKDKTWFRGLCLDGLWEDEDIQRDGVEAAATALAMETAMWDAPDFFNP